MKIFGLKIGRSKALSAVGGALRNGWRVVSESFPGAWQKNVEETVGDLVTYPTLYSCLHRVSSDIGKLPFSVLKKEGTNVLIPADLPAISPVLERPNGFQTGAQFREAWMLSKLNSGNTYVLIRNNGRKIEALYVLDPNRVMPMVSESGQVYYQLQTDSLNSLPDGYPSQDLIVPSTNIIHDRYMPIHHPLIGVPPVASAHWPALKNMKIMRSATDFFANNAQPGGLLTAPAGMSDDDIQMVDDYWKKNFSGPNSGKVAVIGADMKFVPFAMKSVDSQLIEQMKYSDQQICQPFGIPPFKVGIGSIPAGLGVDGVNQLYYSDALQTHIEHMEILLNQGLGVPDGYRVKLDLEPLLRMDEGKRAEVATKLVSGGIETPNEGRSRFHLLPIEGGDTVYLQQQDIPLDQARLNRSSSANEPTQTEEPDGSEDEEDKDLEEMKAFLATEKAIVAMNQELTHAV